ncbi:protein kinase [Marinicella sp. W31]|uniref:protein kinase domain-containing protein n=1 Tax=Marinicella sp. W31 TaxID=3023713 RepID=UPI003757769F
MSYDYEDKLIQYADKAAHGKVIKETSSDKSSQVRAFNLLSKIKQSFNSKHKENIFRVKPGDQWGQLIIGEEIGSGAMGQVFEAYDKLLERNVAVKFLNPAKEHYLDSNTFIQEARRLAKIRHPHVLAIFGANSYKKLTGFWSERLSGSTLDKVSSDKFSWKKILSIASELAFALSEVHKNHLIHGDIKPQNVMLEPLKGVVLMDFGSAHEVIQDSQTISTSTPLIMAPELFDGFNKTMGSDIYALGVLFYYISTNKRYPHEASTLNELSKLVKEGVSHAKSFKHGSRQWKQLVHSLLSIDPKKRPEIQKVNKIIKDLKEKPFKRIKKIAVYSLLALVLGVSSVILYSNVKLKAANKKINAALTETNQFNSLLRNIFSSASPIDQGKDVLMVDVMDGFTEEILDAENINNLIKSKALSVMSNTYDALGYHEKSLDLDDKTLALPDLTPLIRTQLLSYKSRKIIRRASTQNIDIMPAVELLDTAENLFTQIHTEDNHALNVRAQLDMSQAMLFKAQNKIVEANKHIKSAIEFYSTQPESKETHLNLGVSYNIQALLAAKEQNYEFAIEMFEKSIINFRKTTPKININLVEVMNNLAGLYGETQQHEKARDLFKVLVNESEQLLGIDHPNRLVFLINYASTLQNTGEHELSNTIIDSSLSDIKKVAGRGSQLHLVALGTSANNYKALGLYETADKTYNLVIDTVVEKYGKSHQLFFLNTSNLAEFYIENNEVKRANFLLLGILEESEKFLGRNNFINIEIQELFAWSNALLGNDLEDVKSTLLWVIDKKTEIYGAKNESTLKAVKRFEKINKE